MPRLDRVRAAPPRVRRAFPTGCRRDSGHKTVAIDVEGRMIGYSTLPHSGEPPAHRNRDLSHHRALTARRAAGSAAGHAESRRRRLAALQGYSPLNSSPGKIRATAAITEGHPRILPYYPATPCGIRPAGSFPLTRRTVWAHLFSKKGGGISPRAASTPAPSNKSPATAVSLFTGDVP